MPKFTPALDCTTEQRPRIELSKIDSRKLHAVGYCPTRQTFAAQFAEGGPIYHYEGFTPEQYAAFQAAESKGVHFGQHIQILDSKKFNADPAAQPEQHTSDVNPDDSGDEAKPTSEELEAAGQARLIG